MSKTAFINSKQHIRSSFRDAIFTSLNIGMAESYFCAFMLALGISEIVSGMGTIIAQFIGVVFQLFSIRSFFRQYSLKSRVLLFLGLQTLMMIPLILIGWFRVNSAVLVISVLGLYWANLLSSNPPWNRLMGHTVPLLFRLKFFSIRNQFAQSAVFVGLILGGIALHYRQGLSSELKVYVAIFSLGFFLKCLSWCEIRYRHQGFTLAPGNENRLSFRDFLKSLNHTEQGKLLSFLFFFYIVVYFSAPYFNPYMLKHLRFSYFEYMGVTAVSYLGRVLTLRFLQNRAKSRHINRLLVLSTIGLATTPLWWALSQRYEMIVLFEFLSGCYWAGFELSTILLYYQKIEDHERTSVMTYITFLNTTGMVIGTSLGAVFMECLPVEGNSYLILFAVSTLLRFLVIMFAPHVNFRGQVPKLIQLNRLLGARPQFGAFSWPVIRKNKKEKKEK